MYERSVKRKYEHPASLRVQLIKVGVKLDTEGVLNHIDIMPKDIKAVITAQECYSILMIKNEHSIFFCPLCVYYTYHKNKQIPLVLVAYISFNTSFE